MKISVNLCFGNEITFLPHWVEQVRHFADEIVCSTNGSTDGSKEFMESVTGIPVKIFNFPENIIDENGFSHMKNWNISQSSGDWIVALDADEEMSISKADIALRNSKNIFCISTLTLCVDNPSKRLFGPEVLNLTHSYVSERHYRIFRNIPEIRWKGLIHEELYFQTRYFPIRIAQLSEMSNHVMLHWKHWAPPQREENKEGRYADLICRIVDDPSLREGTDAYWYGEYYQKNKAYLRQKQLEYRSKV